LKSVFRITGGAIKGLWDDRISPRLIVQGGIAKVERVSEIEFRNGAWRIQFQQFCLMFGFPTRDLALRFERRLLNEHYAGKLMEQMNLPSPM